MQLPEGTSQLSVHITSMKTFHREGLVVHQGRLNLPVNVQLEGPTLRTVGEDADWIKTISKTVRRRQPGRHPGS